MLRRLGEAQPVRRLRFPIGRALCGVLAALVLLIPGVRTIEKARGTGFPRLANHTYSSEQNRPVYALMPTPVTLSQDFDSGSLDVDASYYDRESNTVYLEPRRFPSDGWPWGDHWWVYFQVSGVKGLTPLFRLNVSAPFQGNYCGHSFVYSYDQQDWAFFDKHTTAGSCDWGASSYDFGNEHAFAGDEVYIAYGLPYPVSRVGTYVASIKRSPYVLPTGSADGRSLVVGYSNDGTLVDDSRGGKGSVPRQALYGFAITDASTTGHKIKVVLVAGNHSGEHASHYVLQGMVDWLLSDDRRAFYLRKVAEFYVYPMLDPDGRWAGYFRSNPANPAMDHNRHWSDPPASSDWATWTSVIKADTEPYANWFFDFHTCGSSTENFYYDHSTENADRFVSALSEYEPALKEYVAYHPGMASAWATSADGLGAPYSIILDVGVLARQPADRYYEIGQHLALALCDQLLVIGDGCDRCYLSP